VGEKAVALDDVENGGGDGMQMGCHEGAAVLSGDEELGGFGLGEHGADGSPRRWLAEGEDVGRTGLPLEG